MKSELSFRPPVAQHHRRIDVDRWDDVYVVGDVHGCADTLERLLDRFDNGRTLFLFVGDLVRKGPDSKGALDLVRERDNLVSVRGNNEQKLIDGRKSIDSLTDNDLAFVESMPLVLSWDGALVVHGGIDHRKPLVEHTPQELLNNRSLVPGGSYDRPYWFETRDSGRTVFFGHTVLDRPFATPWAVGLDTGCVYGGELTAYRCSTGEFVSVDPPETYVERSSDSIVEPQSAVVN